MSEYERKRIGAIVVDLYNLITHIRNGNNETVVKSLLTNINKLHYILLEEEE